MIEIKPKKCKGQNRALGYEGCGKWTKHRKYGLCRMCYTTWLTTTPEGRETIQKARITGTRKLAKQKEKEERDKMKKMKDNVTDYKKLLQAEINKIARLIDKDLPCLATLQTRKNYHAGHVYSRGANQSMRYNLHNIHRQSPQSNHYQSDDLKMREGLIREYGESYAFFVYQLKQTPALKFRHDDYRDMTKRARLIVKELKEKDSTYTAEERIELRNKLNMRIGVYRQHFSIYKKDKYKNVI